MKFGSRVFHSSCWALIWSLGSFALAACDRAPSPKFAPKQVPLALPATTVTRLEIFKSDARTGERWNASLARPAADSRTWKIESSPQGDLGDRMAASGFIHHLLDTFTTLQIRELAPRGTLESFGLAPPQLGVKLVSENTASSNTQELRIGAGVTHADAPQGSRYAQFPPDPTVYVIEGAALKMLEHMDTFQSLRQQNWPGELDTDDIDEIEILEGPMGKKSYFYAQREGSVWTDRKHKPLSKSRLDAQGFLDHLAHSRVQEFIDDSARKTEILANLAKRPGFVVKLTHRGGSPVTRLTAAWVVVAGTESSYGTVDSREGQVFRIHPDTLRYIEGSRR